MELILSLFGLCRENIKYKEIVFMASLILSASTLCKDIVKNNNGENLGEIKDIMIDTDTGQVCYYVLSFGGFLGMGDKYFAIPPQAISVDGRRKHLVLNVDKQSLRNAPGFDKNNWPNMADHKFRDRVYSHFGFSFGQTA